MKPVGWVTVSTFRKSESYSRALRQIHARFHASL
jgi:hypothetical protein